jgi:phosphate transport system substrate-binding protein
MCEGNDRIQDQRADRRRVDRSRRDALAMIGAPLALAALARLAKAQDAPPVDVDATPFPSYIEEPAIKGTVRCVGSSAVGLLINAIRPGFTQSQPDIAVEMISSGSGSGPRALAEGACDLAPMSRDMRPAEIESIEKARGDTVDSIAIAIDAIAIGVNTRNPITRISLNDLDRVFGRERRRGGAPAVKWSDLGVAGVPIADRTITLFGMGSGTGSNGIVAEIVLQGGPFRTSVNEEPVSSSVVQAIATDASAIGYCSVLFESVRVRNLEVEALDGSGFVAPTDASIRAGRYPLARTLRLYYLRGSLVRSPATRKFLQFMVSQDGQEAIGDMRQKTLLPKDARAMFAKLG